MKVTEFQRQTDLMLADPDPQQVAIGYSLLKDQSVWSNSACIGYVSYALRHADVDQKAAADIMEWLGEAFDVMTVEEAEGMA